MKKFNLYIDTNVTIWKRDYLEVESPSQEYMEAILQANITQLLPLLENPNITELTINKVTIKKSNDKESIYLDNTEQIIEDAGSMEIYLDEATPKCIADY